MCFAHVAQSVEHTLGKGEVTGSSPVMGSRVFAVFIAAPSASVNLFLAKVSHSSDHSYCLR